jgi:hypothetical protein
MNQDYLIIYNDPRWEGSGYMFLGTEEEMIFEIEELQYKDCVIMFAAKIAVIKEFIG